MNISEFCEVLSNCSDKENLRPASTNSAFELPSQQARNLPQNLLQMTQFKLDAIIKTESHIQYIDHSKFWEVDGDTFVIKYDDSNTFIAKCTLHQAIVLTPIQIPILLVVVASIKDQAKLLLRVAAFVAKFDDLPPCIFQLQIQPGFHQLSPILALPTHRDALDLFLNHAPLLPKIAVQQMKHMHGELDTTMPNILILNPMLNLQVVYLFKLRPLNFPCDIIKNFFCQNMMSRGNAIIITFCVTRSD